jgi:hypothetical protein
MRRPLAALGIGIAGIVALVVGGLLLIVFIDPFGADQDWKEAKARKEILLGRRTSKEEAVKLLGDCVDYSRDGTNAATLKVMLDREPNNWLTVRERAREWPGVLFTTTMNVQTWVFLDESNRVVDVILDAE